MHALKKPFPFNNELLWLLRCAFIVRGVLNPHELEKEEMRGVQERVCGSKGSSTRR